MLMCLILLILKVVAGGGGGVHNMNHKRISDVRGKCGIPFRSVYNPSKKAGAETPQNDPFLETKASHEPLLWFQCFEEHMAF